MGTGTPPAELIGRRRVPFVKPHLLGASVCMADVTSDLLDLSAQVGPATSAYSVFGKGTVIRPRVSSWTSLCLSDLPHDTLEEKQKASYKTQLAFRVPSL